MKPGVRLPGRGTSEDAVQELPPSASLTPREGCGLSPYTDAVEIVAGEAVEHELGPCDWLVRLGAPTLGPLDWEIDVVVLGPDE